MGRSLEAIGRSDGLAVLSRPAPGFATRHSEMVSQRARSRRLARMGRSDEALAAIEQAIELHRDVACVNPRPHEAAMAQLLSILAVRLAQAGRIEDSLTASERSVDVYERLAAAQPDVYEPVLAQRLSNLALRLAKTRRRADAVAVSQRVLDIHRRLAGCDPARFEPLLWSSLSNHADRLTEATRHDEARRVRAEAGWRRTRCCVHLARPDHGPPHAAPA